MQIAYHQAIVTFQRADFELKDDIENIVKSLQLHGNLVDVNFDYFPHFIVPTFTKPESVKSLIQFYSLKFDSKKGVEVPMKAKQMSFIIPVWNS